MSEMFEEGAAAPPARGGRRTRALAITLVVVVAVIIALTIFASVYTDRLWYRSAGFGNVFSVLLVTKLVLFVVFGLLMGLAVAVNVYLAFRFRPFFRPSSPEQTNLDRYRDVVTPIRTWLLVAVGLVIGVFAGSSGMGHWRTYLLWRNAQSFGKDDPYFGKDIGFYVFHLPWWHYVVNFCLTGVVLALIAATVVHYLYGGIRLQSPHDRLSGAAQVQLSVLLGLFVLIKGFDYYLDRFDLVNAKGSLFTGLDYTADNAQLPSKNILVGVSLICALLFFLNVWRRTWQLPSVGLALLALSAVLLGVIWPAIVQQFQVNPSEADKENPYIAKNINATRDAYDLTGVQVDPYEPGKGFASSMRTLMALSDATSRVPLIDPKVVQPTFEQLQQSKSYFTTAPVLDVDHYTFGATERALVLGVRELDQSRLPSDAQNWSNLHTVYTHGNGIIAAYANGRDAQDDPIGASTASGDDAGIDFAQGEKEDDLQQSTGGYEDRVYYGQNSPDYSIVGKASASAPNIEYNLPTAGDDASSTTFDGSGDAPVGGTFNQLMFAIKFGDANFLLSGRVNSNSKVLFDRDPRQRVQKVAPWLTVDSDPYPAVVDGRILWVVDGYTTTDRYPGSQRESLDKMTTDAQQVNNGLQPLPTDEINYMRNAVKATVDAESGQVTLYQWDSEDPLLKAWMSAFPGTVEPRAAISPDLLAHLRYPEDLFKVQRYQFARYHVTNSRDWYQNNDRWEVPSDPYITATSQAPYRMYVGGSSPSDPAQYSLTSVYVPYGKTTLASYLSVDSNAASDDYGHLKVLALQSSDQTGGPGQVANQFASDKGVQTALRPFTNNNSAAVTPGNVLTFPVAGQLMNVQPVYTSRSAVDATYPRLTFVLVNYGGAIGVGSTLPEALADLGSGTAPSSGGQGGSGTRNGSGSGNGSGNNGGGGAGPSSVQQRIDDTVAKLQGAFDAADTALRSGDLGSYQSQVKKAQQLFDHLVTLRGLHARSNSSSLSSTPSASSSSSTSPTPSQTANPAS